MSHPAGRLQTRVFRVGAIQVDEAAQELRVDGQRRDLEAKPLAVLMVLLTRAGTRVSKRSLIEAVWGNPDHISEASLTTAISKLRAALGGAGRELIDMVPGAGYRIAAPVEIFASRAGTAAFAFSPGESVPGRPQWRLERLLGAAPLNDVWLARHAKTGERRVFKFADSTIRLETLQREAALSRVLHAALGPRDDLIRILEWNFDQRPYFMESAYGGLCMPLWADSRGGLAAIPIGERLLVVARIARTLAAAHSAGVIHGDIKPTNVLIEAPDGRFDAAAADRPTYVRLVDFGAGGVSDATRLAQLAISGHGLADPSGARASGTVRYLAPEVLAGGVPTTAADIYALGMLLFQLAAADLDKTIAPGWEDVIADELLREDIAAAAAGDPARRLASATLLAERLETLAARHAARRAAQLARAHAADLARQVERARLRRPWILLAAASLAAGLALSAGFGISAVHDRDIAERREAVVQAVNGFLTEDLLGRGNPANSGKADETLMDAAQAAEAGIDRRLAHDPMVAGAIYLSLARAFDSRSSYAAARNAYDRAIAAFGRAGAEGRADAVIARLHEASMEVTSGQPGSMMQARQMIAAATPQIVTLGKRRAEAQVWLDAGTAMLQMLGGDVRAAQIAYTRAADSAEAMPAIFNASTRMALRQREAFTYMRLGDWATAQRLFAPLLQQRLALNGPRHPDTLQTELNLAQIRIAQGDAAAALREIDRIYPDFVAVFGPDHIRTLQLIATRAEALLQLQRYDEALADQMSNYRIAVARQGEHSYFALGSLVDASASRCRAGQIDAGLELARSAHDQAAAAFGMADALTQSAAGDLAFCLALHGDSQAALSLIDGIDSQAVAQLTMDPEYGAELDLIRAAAELGLGHMAVAQRLLARSAGDFAMPGADPFMRRWRERLMQPIGP